MRRVVGWHRRGAPGLAGVAAGLCYSSFLLAPLLGSRLSPADSFVSELDVAGQPASGFFRLTDVAAGVLIVILAVGLLRALTPDVWSRLALGCLAVVGLASIGDGMTPMPCSPTTNLACRRRLDQVGIATQLRQPHTLTSVLGVGAAMAATLLLGTHLTTHRRWSPLGSASRATSLVLTLLAGVEVHLALAGRGIGVEERLHVLLISTWLVALGRRGRVVSGHEQEVRPDEPSADASRRPPAGPGWDPRWSIASPGTSSA